MKKNLNFKRPLNFKSPISIALSFSLLAQPFLAQLAQAQSTQNISYDTNGNMTQDENGNTYEYDAENKLISFVKGDGSLKTEYTYYADGLRKSKQITSSSGSVSDPIVFYYDHAKNANVVNEVQGSGSSQVTSSYLMVGDTRYARYLSNDASKPKYYVKNHKDTTMTVGANGADPISHAYTPYGVERDSKGTGVSTADFSIASNPFLYSSQYSDAESGLQYLRARYYKADHMRFISRDTNSVPRNKYAYANGNPIMEDDPSGMMASWVKSFLSIGAGIVAGAAIGFVTGGLGTSTAALVGGMVAEGVGGAVAQSGVSSLVDQKSFFNESTLENMATGAALGAVTGSITAMARMGSRIARAAEAEAATRKSLSSLSEGNNPLLGEYASDMANKDVIATGLKNRANLKGIVPDEYVGKVPLNFKDMNFSKQAQELYALGYGKTFTQANSAAEKVYPDFQRLTDTVKSNVAQRRGFSVGLSKFETELFTATAGKARLKFMHQEVAPDLIKIRFSELSEIK